MSKKEFRLSDQVIGQLREVLQLAMLTGTNFVDHCRVLRLEESSSTEDTLILSAEYVKGWNEMSENFHKQAQEKAEAMSKSEAVDEVVESENEVVISKDPTTGKLVGVRQKVQN